MGILSITDHDTVDGIHDIDFDDKEVEIITGIELSSFIDIKGNKFCKTLSLARLLNFVIFIKMGII